MTREEQIVDTFVEFADTFDDDFDVVEFLHRLVVRCVELLDCAEAGLLLADPAGVLRVMACSSERAEVLELLQAQYSEGPCYEAYHRGMPVFSEDLTADLGRWPTFAPAAGRKGFGSVHALPMRVRRQTVGTLNLFRAETGRLADPDVSVGQGLADIAAVAVLQQSSAREARGVIEQLHGALSSRVIIEQAKGVLAERTQIGVDAAFARLRAYARAHNRRLSEVARELVDGDLDVALLVGGARSASSPKR